MLDLLHIENIAVIEQADVEFGPGLNVLTGETGAGKSIIIDAIGAILGGRVTRELVRTGADAALISAELGVSPEAEAWLRENGIPFEPGEDMVVTRRIIAEGKNTCRVNGVPLPASQLRELGDLLFDVHGQNDGRRLLSESSHRRYLDRYAGLEEDRNAFSALYRRYTAVLGELEDVKQAEADREYRTERLKREIRELEAAELKEGEEEALRERANTLQHLEKLQDKLQRAYECFHGDEDAEGIVSLSLSAETAAEYAARYAASLSELAKNIGDLRYRAEDLEDQLTEALRELEITPGELDRIEERLNLIHRMTRRYGSLEAAAERLDKARNELEDVEYLSEKLEELQRESRDLREELLTLGKALTASRKNAGLRLSRSVEQELSELSMPGARFTVELIPKGNEGFDSGGMEEVRFLLSANAGEEPGRLSRIASGGELSRIMLALKNVLRGGGEEILVFDEIDTGVSGIAAQRVGEKLAELAGDRQVLCVTHLPQLAAMADTQFSIVKLQRGGRTFTQVNKLSDTGRQEELARLIGGETVTETTLQGAGELIAAAQRYKNQQRKRFEEK